MCVFLSVCLQGVGIGWKGDPGDVKWLYFLSTMPCPTPAAVRTPSKLSELVAPENLIEEAARASGLVVLSPCCSLAGPEQKAHAYFQRTFYWRILVGSKGLLLSPQATQEPASFLLQP